MGMIPVPMERYDELVAKEARINALIDMLNYDKAMRTDDIYRILGKPVPVSNEAESKYDTLITEL